MPRPGIKPLLLFEPVAPVSASVKVLFPTCSDPDPQVPEKKSRGVKPEPLGGTSTIATLFRFVTLRLLNVSEIAVIVPERPLTVAVEPCDCPRLLLTVIPPDEVHVVTFPEVVHEARACAGSSRSAPMTKTNKPSLSSAERSGIAERTWCDMGRTSRCRAIGDFQRTPLANDWATVKRSSFERWKISRIGFAVGGNIVKRWLRTSLGHGKSFDEQ
jgi:hypothetical protein